MTYCQTADSHERRAVDLLTVALEKEASAQRLKRMAWDAKATKLLHQTNCPTCTPETQIELREEGRRRAEAMLQEVAN